MTVETTEATAIDGTSLVGLIATQNPASTRVFEKYRIDFCCNGGVTLAHACESAAVALETVLSDLEDLESAGPEKDWSQKSLTELSRHIVATHHVYTREECEALGLLASKVDGVHGENHPELHEVSRIVHLMRTELSQHMMKEEQILFPFVEQLEKAVLDGEEATPPFFGTVRNPIQMMMAEHDQAGEMLRSLRVITSDYTLPEDACTSYRALYHRLKDLELDLHQHIHLENNIYFPGAVSLEQKSMG